METFKLFRQSVLVQHLNLSAVPAARIMEGRGKAINTIFNGKQNLATPEHEALWFYLRNHATAVLQRQYDPAEPIHPTHLPFVAEYYDIASAQAMRMFYYLIQICARESRHAGSCSSKLYPKWPKLVDFHQSYKGTNQAQVLKSLEHNLPHGTTMGELSQFLVDSFYMCSYSGGYGGKKWGAIADTLNSFVKGETTAEMMLDTAWTLSHNNGPIFNKGMWYEMYNGNAIAEILDVQRAGMIPQYVNDVTGGAKYTAGSFVTKEMREYVKRMQDHSTEFSGCVNWPKLKELGALGNYSYKSAKPLTPAELEKIKAANAKKAAKEALKWQITPGNYAYTTTRAEVAAL